MTTPFPIDEIAIHVVRMPLIEPFTTSFGTVQDRDQILIEVRGGGISGWGEAAVLPFPFYNPETPQTALHILKDFAIPMFFKAQPVHPAEVNALFERIVGHRIARGGLEMAYWDWYAKSKGQPLFRMLGATRSAIPVGVSVPLFKDEAVLLERIEGFLGKGYQRIKIKIEPGRDLALVQQIVKRFGKIPLMVDANSAYSLSDLPLFRALDEFGLMMIEQPLREGDIYEHSLLQKQIHTPICLDESIEHLHHATAATALGSCKIINIKMGRVGGIAESQKIHDYCARNDIGVWCGGMLETGVGRAHNMTIASLPNFCFPGDISESKRYYHEDIVSPDITLSPQGTLSLQEAPGIGFEVDRARLTRYTRATETIRP